MRPGSRTLALGLAAALGACREPLPLAPVFDDVTRAPRDASPPPRRILRVANFNVRRHFDPVCDSGRCGPGDFEAQPSPEAFAARSLEIARGIAQLDADLVCLEEVENQPALDAITRALPGYPTAVLGETGFAASVDVALVARWPARAVQRHREAMLRRPDGSSTVFAREFLQVDLVLDLDREAAGVTVFCAHFRSQRNDDPGRRLAEAEGAREIILRYAEAAPERIVVLAGDLNDVPESAPLEALGRGGRLVRAVDPRAPERAHTYVFDGVTRAIDHVWFVAGAPARLVPESVSAHWQRFAREGFAGSDHAAITAEFEFLNPAPRSDGGGP